MIDPWKTYKTKDVGIVTDIQPLDSYIPYVQVNVNGRLFSGSIHRAYHNPAKLKVGDKVRVGLQFSIVSDTFLVSKLVKVRKA